jgi:hypothetical protein
MQWFHAEIARQLEQGYKRLERGENVRLMIFMPPRHGKQLDHDTPIFTTVGWKRHGDLVIGDYVFSPSGKPIKVLSLSDESLQDCEIDFHDGTSIKCHENHEWNVYDRSYAKWRTVETKYLEKAKQGTRARFQLPLRGGLVTKSIELPIDPYFLGVWLGDGKAKEPTISMSFEDITEVMQHIPYKQGYTSVHKKTGVYYQNYVGGIRKVLGNLDLLNNKHIPDIYFLSSQEQRYALLQGLVDTDGSVESNGRVRVRSAWKELAKQIAILVESLGYRASIDYTPADTRDRVIKGGPTWCVQWTPHDGKGSGFISRKNIPRYRERRRLGIKSIRRVTPSYGRCITVDSPDGLYLAGYSFIPTHNSDTATQKFPSWVLGKQPQWPIMVSSYSDELATDFGMLTRTIMQTDEYSAMFDTKLRGDAKAKGKWITDSGGSYTAVGVGGALTGRGFKIGIIDDPFKNREEADSPVVRESRYNWYRSTFYTRQEGASMIVFILTRWHEDDLAGRVLRDSNIARMNGEPYDEWDIIQYKALATENDDHRSIGDALWPDKFNQQKLLTMRTTMGGYEFSALYQQTPIDEENRKFKESWYRYKAYETLDTATTYNIMTIDPRGRDDIKEGKDFVGITVNFIENANRDNITWNFMSYREKLSATGLIDLLFTNWQRYHLRKIGIEDNQFTQGLLMSIREEMRKRGVYMDIILLKTGGTQKELRIEALVPRYENGGIFHLTIGGANQCLELEDELKLFPKSANDDASDSAAYQLQMPMRSNFGEAGIVTSTAPDQQVKQAYSLQNNQMSGGQINIGKAVRESEEY